jgi:galactose mutarotase-like enzyme
VSVSVVDRRGWTVVQLASDRLEVDVLPGKGGDILGVTWRPQELNVLWSSPWGLREKGSVPTAADSRVAFLESYPGGWQTLFPNGGDATEEQGVELGFHGEATMIPWRWEQLDDQSIAMSVELVRSPFSLRRVVRVDGASVTVTEAFKNTSLVDQPAMWSHHPAFGAPFLDSSCRVEVGAASFQADPGYDTPHTDLMAGETRAWPLARSRDGGDIDLREVPSPEAQVDRMGYLLDFTAPWYSITNPQLGLTATVRWDGVTFPYAWLWTEAAGSAGFPWHQRAYVLAIEPASSYPGSGLDVAKENGTALWFAPGQEHTVEVSMEISDEPAVSGE